MAGASRSYKFGVRQRLHGRRGFAAVFAGRTRKAAGPLLVYALVNDLDRTRLGLSVGAKVGSAPQRNRIKRLLREAFRLSQHELPPGYDLVVVVRPHPEQTLGDYRRLLGQAAAALDATCRKKSAAPRPSARGPAASPDPAGQEEPKA